MVLRRYREILNKFQSLAEARPTEQQKENDLQRYFARCLLIRVILLSVTLALVTWGLFLSNTPIWDLGFAILAAIFGISAVQAVILRVFSARTWAMYFQLITDVILASAIFGFSQSNVATFLYLLVIIAAAGSLQMRGALIIATTCSLLYSAILGGLVPMFQNVHGLLPHEVLLVHLSFIVSAFLSSFLAVRLKWLWSFAQDQAENVRVLKEREAELLLDLNKAKVLEEKLSYHERVTELLASKDSALSVDGRDRLIAIVGESSMMRNLFTLVERVAVSEASVLITGESGTGKELIARAIHELSPRKNKSFVAINCGAIPESLIESELFGHKRGSFTGAISDNIGLFRKAQGGTLFLDEIGELPPAMQTKLLRALQEHVVRAVGDVQDISINVRVVAATNRDLKKEISQARFREDLYYRLNVVNLVVPPLRERKEDLPLLIRHFLTKYCDADSVVPTISPEALQCLRNYPFPGNIRELENVIERALVLGGNAILPEHLPEEVRLAKPSMGSINLVQSPETQIIELPLDLDSVLSQFERHMLLCALERTGGAKKQAAELLGLNFRSFRYRLKKYGMGGDEGRPESEGDL